ncbi:DM9 repeat-containing protein [Acidobacteriota bacterium]
MKHLKVLLMAVIVVTLFSTGAFAQSAKWIKASKGQVPDDAVPTTPRADSYVCRCEVDDQTIVPGELKEDTCRVAQDGKELQYSDYEVLTDPEYRKNLRWVSHSSREAVRALGAGREGSEPQHICRAVVEGKLRVGRASENKCYIAANGKEYRLTGQYFLLSLRETPSEQAKGRYATKTKLDETVCDKAKPSVEILHPPNHKFTKVTIEGEGIRNARIKGVSSDECVTGKHAGKKGPDAVIARNKKSVDLRSERNGQGDGRVYHIDFEAGTCEGTVTVCVPKGNKAEPCGDQGPKFDATLSSTDDFTECGGDGPTPTPTPGTCDARPSVLELKPPNHKFTEVTIEGVTNVEIKSVKQDECVDKKGGGDKAPDAMIASSRESVNLRAERDGQGDGRVYHIEFTADECDGVVTVCVPHGNKPCGDQGPKYESEADSSAGYPECGGAPPTPTPTPGTCDAQPSLSSLHPPNHKFVNVTIKGVTNAKILGVAQDECVDKITGKDDKVPDAEIAPDGSSVNLRSERFGQGDGRVYHIVFTADECSGSVTVCVPKGANKPCVDQGALYDSQATSSEGHSECEEKKTR